LEEEPVESFSVFISSSQEEFERLRTNLRDAINAEEFARQRIMRAVLVEEKRGSVIRTDIEKGIDGYAIYVGIFGQVYSDWTAYGFRMARMRGLPLLVYRFRRQKGRGRPRKHDGRGRRSKVEVFLEDEAKRFDIRVRGPYSSENSLEDAMLTDLALQVADMVAEIATVRKVTHRS